MDPQELPTEEGEYYDRQLIGMDVILDGLVVATVNDVIHLPSQDLLEITMNDERKVLVPFVNEIVPDVDVAKNALKITPPPGLIDEDLAIVIREEGEADEV